MNGFRKNKGIIIELTSLLDIIMIMLFWVMLNVSQTADNEKEKAQAKIDSANSQVQQVKDDAEKQLAEKDKENEAERKQAQQLQEAVNGINDGNMITINLKFQDNSDVLYINQGEDKNAVSLDDNLEENIVAALEEYGINEDSVILAAFVYDGNTVLYRDANRVESALRAIHENYANLYITYINATE